jgi:hypothetical protein
MNIASLLDETQGQMLYVGFDATDSWRVRRRD